MVNLARRMQAERKQDGLVEVEQNALLILSDLERVAEPAEQGKNLLELAIEKNLLSARGYVRVLRVARTLADMEEVEQIGATHIGEALRYRLPDLAEI